jgi:hypothetical protein
VRNYFILLVLPDNYPFRTLKWGRKQCKALRFVFSDVSKSTLFTNNGLNAVLGPLLVGPYRGLSPIHVCKQPLILLS